MVLEMQEKKMEVKNQSKVESLRKKAEAHVRVENKRTKEEKGGLLVKEISWYDICVRIYV